MQDLKPFLKIIAEKRPLSREETRSAFEVIFLGAATPAQIGAFLMGLRLRGESVAEIAGAVAALRAAMTPVEAPENAIDIVGTGGDGANSYNVSTLAAFIVAGCGLPVAKHGNRAVSSQSGSSDVLACLGVRIGLPPEGVAACIREAGIGFMWAQAHHPALRYAAVARQELGVRTLLNLLGPLANPASVRRQLVGVYSRDWLLPLAETLRDLGSERVWLVCGSDGLDEITLTGPTHGVELNKGAIRAFDIIPEDAGLMRVEPEALTGGDPTHNASALKDVLDGAQNAYRDIAVLNAAAALVVADRAQDLREGAAHARKSLDSGAARAALEKLAAVSHRY